MDIDEAKNTFPTLERFTKETGIKVDYVESIDGNETFFTSNLAGPLGADLPTQWDLIVMTDWMIARLIRLGWLEPLDPMPNFPANLLEIYHARSFDPNTNMAAPLQSGMTGMMIDKKKTGVQDSLSVLFGKKFNGKVTYLDEMRDTVGLSALQLGVDPARHHPGGVRRRHGGDQKGRQAGMVRQFQGNAYAELMIGGDAVLSMGWSGDVVLIQLGQTKTQDFSGSCRRGRDAVDRQHGHPEGHPEQAAGPGLDRLLLRPDDRRGHRGLRQLRLPGQGRLRRVLAMRP